jgi:hypothetical protein
MSAGHQIKKASQAETFANWAKSVKRTVNGHLYATRREARRARELRRLERRAVS